MRKEQKEAMEQLKNLKTFGEMIREGRNKCGFSKSSLAEILTDRYELVTERDISKWERDAKYPDITLIYKICDKLKLDPNEMLKAKLIMQESGLNSIDMVWIRTICKLLDMSIWGAYYLCRVIIIVVLGWALITVLINYVKSSVGPMF